MAATSPGSPSDQPRGRPGRLAVMAPGEAPPAEYLWRAGGLQRREEAMVPVTQIGWPAVGAVFEGIRAYWNADRQQLFAFRLVEHFERLRRSARLVHLPLVHKPQEMAEWTLAVLRVNGLREDAYIFPFAYPPNANAKRFEPLELECELVIDASPRRSFLGSGRQQRARTSSWVRIGDNVMPPRVKSFANYRNSQLASHEARMDGYDCAFILNSEGKVSEANGATIFMVRDGVLATPAVTDSILESVTRDSVIALARDVLGLPVQERPIDRTELYLADEVFTCGTAVEVTAISSLDRFEIGAQVPGPVTRRVDSLFNDVARGYDNRYAQWRTPVGVSDRVLPTRHGPAADQYW
jgi:branched-chain amino acid aminotransferase